MFKNIVVWWTQTENSENVTQIKYRDPIKRKLQMINLYKFYEHIPDVEMVQVAVAAAMGWAHVRDWVVDRHAVGMAVDVHWVQGWRLVMVRSVAMIWVMVRCTVYKPTIQFN